MPDKVQRILDAITDPDLRSTVQAGWGLGEYTPMPSDDPAQSMMEAGGFTVPTIYDPRCYICRDPEYAMIGMSLCFPCAKCGSHIAADEEPECPHCGYAE